MCGITIQWNTNQKGEQTCTWNIGESQMHYVK